MLHTHRHPPTHTHNLRPPPRPQLRLGLLFSDRDAGRQRSRWTWARFICAEGRLRRQAAFRVVIAAIAQKQADCNCADVPCTPSWPELESDL